MTSATNSTQEYHNPHSHANSSTVTQQPMPRVEHQASQRPVQLKDTQKYTRLEEDQGCLSSFESSAGGEFRSLWSWIHTFRNKGRRKKMDAARQRKQLEDARQRAHEGFPKSSVASALGASTPERLAGLPQRPSPTHTHASSNLPRSPRVPKPIGGIAVAPQHGILRKPAFKYRDTPGMVPRYPVKVRHPSVRRKSVHLSRTNSNNYRVLGEPEPRKTPNSSRVTKFGDFISQELNTQPMQSSTPTLPAQETPGEFILSKQAYRGTRWTFTSASASISSNIILPKTVSKGQFSESQVKHEDCSMCGTPNSPGTRYGDQGLWLCTACRNPTTAIEFPPRTISKEKPEHERHRSAFPAAADIHIPKDEPEVCGSCHTSLPPVERDGILLCSWCCRQLTFPSSLAKGSPRDAPRLTLRRFRSKQSVSSVNTQDAEEEWQDFDADLSLGFEGLTLSPKISHERLVKANSKQDHHWKERGGEFTPTPPLKDSIYLSKKAYSPGLLDRFAPPPPEKDTTRQPPLRTRKPAPQAIRTTDHYNFYPSTPTTTSPAVIPSHPTKPKIQGQRQNRARKGSSVYPPTPQFTASDFPYPPPSIPQIPMDIRRATRASSVYTVSSIDHIPRLQTPDWQLKSPNRDTSFYGFWETILRDDGTVFRDV